MTTLDDDIDLARKWWLGLAPSIPSEVRGLWFGLFVNASTSPNQHQMYVAGTPTFATDDGGDWACDYIWQPDARYSRLPGLAAIPTTDWHSALDLAVKVVTTVEPWQSSPRDVAGVGVGFDDGDAIVVWSRT